MSWQVDYAHSQIEASARHMMISNVHRRFEKFTVNAQIDELLPVRQQSNEDGQCVGQIYKFVLHFPRRKDERQTGHS